MPNRREVTVPTPRCPICDAIMEEAQLRWNGERVQWEEVWGCDSCHTMHCFPARIAVMEQVLGSRLMPKADRVLYLPK